MFVQVLIKDWVMFAIVGVVVGVQVVILVVGTTVPQIQPRANITNNEEHPTSVNVSEHWCALWAILVAHLLFSRTCLCFLCGVFFV